MFPALVAGTGPLYVRVNRKDMTTISLERKRSRSNASTGDVAGRQRIEGLLARTAKNLLEDASVKPRQPLLGDWLLERGLVLLYAPTGIGKSWLSMAVAAAVAGGGNLHSWVAPEPRRVFYVDGEMDVSDLKDRLGIVTEAASGSREMILRNLMLCSRHDQLDGTAFPNLGDDDGREHFLALARELRPELIILDNMSTLVSVAEENEAAASNPFLKLLQGLQQLGIAVLVVHHANKAGGYRGSSKIAVLFDTILKLSEDPDAGVVNGASFTLAFEKTRRLVAEARSGISARFVAGQWSFEAKYDAVLSEVVAKVRRGEYQRQSEIAADLGVQPPAVSKMKRKAIQAGLITKAEWEGGLELGRELAEDDHDAF